MVYVRFCTLFCKKCLLCVVLQQAKDIRLRLEQDARAQMILKQSLIWLLYIVFLAIVCHGHSSVHDAYQTNVAIKNKLGFGVHHNNQFENVSVSRYKFYVLCFHGSLSRFLFFFKVL